MMQPYNDQVVGRESIPFPNRDIELVKTEQRGERRVREDEGKTGRDEMQGALAASIMWFGAEAICTYCSS